MQGYENIQEDVSIPIFSLIFQQIEIIGVFVGAYFGVQVFNFDY